MICKWREVPGGPVCGRRASGFPIVKLAAVARPAVTVEFKTLTVCRKHKVGRSTKEFLTDEKRSEIVAGVLKRGVALTGAEALMWGRV